MIGLLINIPPKCKCCGHENQSDKSICNECFYIWYENGLTNGAQIGRYCNHARANGYWPFSIHNQMPESEYKALVLEETTWLT